MFTARQKYMPRGIEKQNKKKRKKKTVLQCGTGVQDYKAFAPVENCEKVQLNSLYGIIKRKK